MYYKVLNGGTGTVSITTNGNHNVKKYAIANVNVQPSAADYSFSWSNFRGTKQQTFTVSGKTIVGAGILSCTARPYNGVDMRIQMNATISYNSSSATVTISVDNVWSHTEADVSGTVRLFYV